jgi:myo-inositol-1-phosphate synthase
MQQAGKTVDGAGRKLAVLMPGLGAVATTFVAGVELVRQGRGLPVGSVSQMGMLRGRGGGRPSPIRELLPLARLDELAFGAWDIVAEDGLTVARRSKVLSSEHIDAARSALAALRPRPGVHDPETVRRISADHVADARTHRDRVDLLRNDIRDFKLRLGASRAVMIFTASTEAYQPAGDAVASLDALEHAIDASDRRVTPTMLYAYAAISEGVPFINGTPNVCVDTVAFQELAREHGVVIAGKDFKSGQTMIKTALAPALKARLLGLNGWFSTNILGNRDGEVLDDPQNFRSKEVTKGGVLDSLLPASEQPDLYGEISHKIAIHYYPPRGDAKEGWDNIDLFGWLGYQMQIKVNFLCRDSILAAPLVLDLALFADLAQRSNQSGLQDWLSFYFKSPTPPPGMAVEHDLFRQYARLEEALWNLARREQALTARERELIQVA